MDEREFHDPQQPTSTHDEDASIKRADASGPYNKIEVGDGRQYIRLFTPSGARHNTIRHYALYIPQDYSDQPAKHWPVIVFLHGGGECGEEISTTLLRQDLAKKLSRGAQLPFVVLSPHCPYTSRWLEDETSRDIMEILEQSSKELRLDLDRVYLTGFR